MTLLSSRCLLLSALLIAHAARASPAAAPRAMATNAASSVVTFSFEVQGRVQGVYFRATTVETAHKLGIVGWCRNTRRGTVEGVAQGSPIAAAEFKKWLATGPPAARVDKVDYKEERVLIEAEFDEFSRMATV